MKPTEWPTPDVRDRRRLRGSRAGSSASGRTETRPASAFEASSAQRSDPSRSAALVIRCYRAPPVEWETDGSQTRMHRRRRAACRRRRPSGRPAAGGFDESAACSVRELPAARPASLPHPRSNSPTRSSTTSSSSTTGNEDTARSGCSHRSSTRTATTRRGMRIQEQDSTEPGAGHSRSTTRPMSSSTYGASQPPLLRHHLPRTWAHHPCSSPTRKSRAPPRSRRRSQSARARQPCARLGSHGGHRNP
jgi:hypothetical protein